MVKTKRISGTRAIVYCAFFTALLIVLSQIAIPLPFSPVPFTLGVLGVLLCGSFLGSGLGTATVVIYILFGLMGLPVFAGFSGAAAITGPTGGYIAGYIPMVFLAGLSARLSKKSKVLYFAGLVASVFACYLLGTVWYSVYAKVNFFAAFMVCVVPFVVWDAVKVAVAGILSLRLKKIRLS